MGRFREFSAFRASHKGPRAMGSDPGPVPRARALGPGPGPVPRVLGPGLRPWAWARDLGVIEDLGAIEDEIIKHAGDHKTSMRP